MIYHTLVVSYLGRTAQIIINRPDMLNALNAAMKEELGAIFTELRTNAGVDVVVLTGAGEKAFVAGTDITELTSLDGVSGREFAARGQEVFTLIENLGKPVIAAVNGYALGGGCELALACHVRIASDKARFGQPEVNLGIIPGYGGTQRLSRAIGLGPATDMILTGIQVDAQEALRLGLVSRVFPAQELLGRAMGMAETISQMGQVAIRAALAAVQASGTLDLQEGFKREAELFGQCCASEDFKEGTTAFLQKRKPSFKNQ